MGSVKRGIFIAGSLFFSGALLAAEGMVHVVQPGDTLSQIAADHVGRPIFTKTGSLSKILRLNPQIKEIHQITVGDQIVLSEEKVAAAAPLAHTDRRPAEEKQIDNMTPPPHGNCSLKERERNS